MEGTVSSTIIVTAMIALLSEVVGVYTCPSVCLCYVDEAGLRTANCSGVKFITENKYTKVFHEIDVLNLVVGTDDEPIKLWDDMFMSFAKLKLLNLDNCSINYLPKNVFKGLKKIIEINLASNNIRHFENAVFENIYTLNKLNLRGNQLQGSSKPFIFSSSLRELDLGYCGITFLQSEFFHGVKKLTRLYLDGNHLQTVKEHILPRGITHLNLANNRIVNVPISTINSLSQLRWLDLGANPINCTCSLLNLQDILSGHAIILDGDLRCAYPPELENIKLSKVNENEVCEKEIFSPSRYHFKKAQTLKYAPYQKKEYYFENEKHNPFEIQGDDPGTSTDDYAEENDDYYDKPKMTVHDDEKENLKTEADNLMNSKVNAQKETVIDEHETVDGVEHVESAEKTSKLTESDHGLSDADKSDAITNENEETKTNEENVGNNTGKAASVEETSKLTESDSNLTNDDNTDANVNENQGNKENDDNIANNNENENAKESDPALPSPVENKNEKPDGDVFDENMKNDEVMPVGDLHHNLFSSTASDKSIHEMPEKKLTDENGEHEVINDKERKLINSNEHHAIEENVGKDKEDTKTTHTHSHEENINAMKSVVIDQNEVEGSGSGVEENTTLYPFNPIFQEGTQKVTDEVVQKSNVQPVETFEKKSDENENVGQIVDKQPIDYEGMGSHVVVVGIIVFIVFLIILSVYRNLCRSKETNRKPTNDVEANGTELQDITSSLLPKSPEINDEKHNNKYPAVKDSQETISLVKANNVGDTNEQNESHDLNQNDSKNDAVIKNGKKHENSPPPIEKTKAKLTVLHGSIPRTPIFFQKQPATVNNG